MIAINEEYKKKLEDFYYKMMLEQNTAYLNEHGVGPYYSKHDALREEQTGYTPPYKFRVHPWFDAGYWIGFEKWANKEFNIIMDPDTKKPCFESETDMLVFLLKF